MVVGSWETILSSKKTYFQGQTVGFRVPRSMTGWRRRHSLGKKLRQRQGAGGGGSTLAMAAPSKLEVFASMLCASTWISISTFWRLWTGWVGKQRLACHCTKLVGSQCKLCFCHLLSVIELQERRNHLSSINWPLASYRWIIILRRWWIQR